MSFIVSGIEHAGAEVVKGAEAAGGVISSGANVAEHAVVSGIGALGGAAVKGAELGAAGIGALGAAAVGAAVTVAQAAEETPAAKEIGSATGAVAQAIAATPEAKAVEAAGAKAVSGAEVAVGDVSKAISDITGAQIELPSRSIFQPGPAIPDVLTEPGTLPYVFETDPQGHEVFYPGRAALVTAAAAMPLIAPETILTSVGVNVALTEGLSEVFTHKLAPASTLLTNVLLSESLIAGDIALGAPLAETQAWALGKVGEKLGDLGDFIMGPPSLEPLESPPAIPYVIQASSAEPMPPGYLTGFGENAILEPSTMPKDFLSGFADTDIIEKEAPELIPKDYLSPMVGEPVEIKPLSIGFSPKDIGFIDVPDIGIAAPPTMAEKVLGLELESPYQLGIEGLKAEAAALELGIAPRTAILDPTLTIPQELPLSEAIYALPSLPYLPAADLAAMETAPLPNLLADIGTASLLAKMLVSTQPISPTQPTRLKAGVPLETTIGAEHILDTTPAEILEAGPSPVAAAVAATATSTILDTRTALLTEAAPALPSPLIEAPDFGSNIEQAIFGIKPRKKKQVKWAGYKIVTPVVPVKGIAEFIIGGATPRTKVPKPTRAKKQMRRNAIKAELSSNIILGGVRKPMKPEKAVASNVGNVILGGIAEPRRAKTRRKKGRAKRQRTTSLKSILL